MYFMIDILAAMLIVLFIIAIITICVRKWGNMDKTNLSMTLPKVGDKLFRIMYRGRYEPYDTYCPESCTVVYVNEKKGWYEVCFDETKIKEC